MQTTWNTNAERNGVEVRFSERPEAETLTALKSAGWRWSRFARCWYITDSPEARTFAAQLGADQVEQSAATTPARPKQRTVARHRGDTYRSRLSRSYGHDEPRGLHIMQNPRGRCEDAPCCGCCD